jgi:hypothetical protein
MIGIMGLIGLAFLTTATDVVYEPPFSEQPPVEYETAVVEAFAGEAFGRACILSWRPVGAREGVFYNVYRAPLGGDDYGLRNEEPIPAAVLDGAVPEDELIFIYPVDGSVQGVLAPPDEDTMEYLDGGTDLDAVYKYKLEAVLPGAATQEFGPVLCKTGFPAAPLKNAFFGVGPAKTTGYVELAIRLAKPGKVSASITPKSPSGPAKSMTADLPAGDHVLPWDTGLPPGDYEVSMTLEDYGVKRRQVYSFTVVKGIGEDPGAAD